MQVTMHLSIYFDIKMTQKNRKEKSCPGISRNDNENMIIKCPFPIECALRLCHSIFVRPFIPSPSVRPLEHRPIVNAQAKKTNNLTVVVDFLVVEINSREWISRIMSKKNKVVSCLAVVIIVTDDSASGQVSCTKDYLILLIRRGERREK